MMERNCVEAFSPDSEDERDSGIRTRNLALKSILQTAHEDVRGHCVVKLCNDHFGRPKYHAWQDCCWIVVIVLFKSYESNSEDDDDVNNIVKRTCQAQICISPTECIRHRLTAELQKEELQRV